MKVLRLLERFELDMLHAAIKDALQMRAVSLDFKAIPVLNRLIVLELARCEWIERKEKSSPLAHQAPAKHISPSGWVWLPARRVCRSASSRPPLSYMN